MLPSSLANGHYAVDANWYFTLEGGVNEAVCPAGSYCSGGNKSACGAGDFCGTGSSEPLDCPAGFFCPSADAKTTCQPGFYCPARAIAPSKCVEGATCAVPASPELVILPAALMEMRESEIFKVDIWRGNTSISYDLALSAAPKSSVTVTIFALPDSTVGCKSRDDGIELEPETWEFSPTNFAELQPVSILVERDPTLFEGNGMATFTHSIESKVGHC